MRFLSSPRLISGAIALVVVTACSDATSSNPRVNDEEASVDLAISAGDAIATDLGFLMAGEADGMSFTAGATRGDAQTLGTGGCEARPGGRRECSGTTVGTLTHTRSFAFYDAAGAIQTSFDPITTASINFQMSLSGTITRPHLTATISRERNMTLSGLAGEETERTWNGTGAGSETSTATGDRGTRVYAGSTKDTTTNVVFKLPRAENPWPQSGTIVRRMDAVATFEGARSGTRTIAHRAVVTFNGTENATLQVGTRTCVLNLATRAVSCPVA